MKECNCRDGRLFTQWFREFTCEDCGNDEMHCSWGVPKICIDCAEKRWVCWHCFN